MAQPYHAFHSVTVSPDRQAPRVSPLPQRLTGAVCHACLWFHLCCVDPVGSVCCRHLGLPNPGGDDLVPEISLPRRTLVVSVVRLPGWPGRHYTHMGFATEGHCEETGLSLHSRLQCVDLTCKTDVDCGGHKGIPSQRHLYINLFRPKFKYRMACSN